jgi:hypothetical protein
MATETLDAPATTKPESFLTDPNVERDWEKAIEADRVANEAATRGEKTAAAAPAKEVARTAAPEQRTETAATPAKDEMPPEIKSEEGKKSWANWKKSAAEKESALTKERDEFKTKYETVNSRIAELEKAAKTPAQQAKLEDSPEYQQLKALAESREKTVEEYSERLRLLDVEQHPKFQAYFKNKIDAQHEIAKEIGGDKLVAALQMPAGEYRKEKLNELIAEMGPMEQSQLGSVLTNLRAIESERANEVASAKENYKTIQAQQQEQTQKQQRAIEDTFKAVTGDVTSKEKGLPVFQERAGDAEWNQGVQERLALAQATFNGKLKPEQMAQQAYWAAAAPQLLIELNGALQRTTALEKEILELRAASPGPGGDGGDGGNEVPETAKGLDGMMQMITAALPNR